MPIEGALDLDLEAASYAFDFGVAERIRSLPFSFTGAELRHPFDRVVTRYLANPAAATIDGIPRSEMVLAELEAEGVAFTASERGEVLSWPLSASEARGLRAIALVRRRDLLQRNADIARRQAQDPDDRSLPITQAQVVAEIETIRQFLDDPSGLRSGLAASFDSIFFSGDRLLSLLAEPAPDPVYPGVPPAGHFSLLIAPSFSGKTSLALWNAMALIRGAAPWQGAPTYAPGRVLFYSIDEPPGQVAHRIRSLAMKHHAGRFIGDYAKGITIAGPHPSVDPDQLGLLRFTDDGLGLLEQFLRRAGDEGRAYALVIVDAYSDLLPSGESDSSNEEATRIGGALERLAVTYGCAIQVIHHAGKPVAGQDLPDPRDYGRGASALAAKARAIFTLEEEPGTPNVRRIRTRTNLTASPGPLLVEVCSDRGSDSSRIEYFRPHDAATAYVIDDYLSADDGWISITQLAHRLAGDNDEPDKKPAGSLLRQARELRGIWDNAGLVEIRTGARNALELRRL